MCSENEPPSSSAVLHESSADSSKPAGAKRKLTKAASASTSAAGRGTGRASGEYYMIGQCLLLTDLQVGLCVQHMMYICVMGKEASTVLRVNNGELSP